MTDTYPFDARAGTVIQRVSILAVAAGFLAVAVGVFLAVGTPANGYEGSIYSATPVGFWAGVVLAFAVGLTVALWAQSEPVRTMATVLGGTAATAVAALPLLRGYHYYGELDSLTHLGWVRDVSADVLGPLDLLYPGIHTGATAVSALTGFETAKAVLLIVSAFSLAFFAFVPLAVWTLTTDRRATAVGAFGAFMLLPLNGVVTEPVAHPITQAALFAPFVLALLVRYLSGPNRAAAGALLAIGSVGLVLYHPQAALTVLVAFVAIAVIQAVTRRVSTGPVAGLRPIYAQTAILGVAFLAWTGQFPALYEQSQVAIDSLLSFLGGGEPVADVVEQRSGQLSTIGGGLVGIFLKLFLVSAVFLLLSVLLVGESFVRGIDDLSDDAEGIVRLFGVSLVAIGVVAALHLVGPLSKLVFRYLAIGMGLATVLGAVAIVRYVPRRDEYGVGGIAGGTAVTVAIAAMLALSVATVHASPFTHHASPQITESNLQGYETAFEHGVEGGDYLGIRWPAWRFRHAVAGTAGNPWNGEVAGPDLLGNGVVGNVAGPTYVTVSALDRFRELRAYEELRYTTSDFQGLNAQPGLHRVQSNGEFTVYFTP